MSSYCRFESHCAFLSIHIRLGIIQERKYLLIGLAACLCLFASAICLPSQAAAADERVRIGLRGQISAKCGLSEIKHSIPLQIGGSQRQASSTELDFTIDCNAPFIYGLSSANGALVFRDAKGNKADRAAHHLPYRLELTVPTNDGGIISGVCHSGELEAAAPNAGGCAIDSGQSIATGQKGRIVLRWDGAPSLLAGDYSDGLSIVINTKN